MFWISKYSLNITWCTNNSKLYKRNFTGPDVNECLELIKFPISLHASEITCHRPSMYPDLITWRHLFTKENIISSLLLTILHIEYLVYPCANFVCRPTMYLNKGSHNKQDPYFCLILQQSCQKPMPLPIALQYWYVVLLRIP